MLKQEVADKITELIPDLTKGRIVDIGTGWAESAIFFSKLKPHWTIYTIDGFGLYGDGRIYEKFDHDKVKAVNESLPGNVIQILADSSRVPWELPIDILFIDGDHSYEGCKKDFLKFYPFVTKDGLIIFDDYIQENNPANGVKKFTKEIDLQIIYEGYYCIIFKK